MADDVMTNDERAQLDKDIAASQQKIAASIADSVAQKAKDEGRLEAQKEFELKQQLAAQEAKAKELADKLAAQQKTFEEKFMEQQKRMDSLIESKAVVRTDNQSANGASPTNSVDKLSEQDLDKIEAESAKAFYGQAYDAIYRFQE